MDRAQTDVVAEVQEIADEQATQRELSSLQLALIGGGVGEVVFY